MPEQNGYHNKWSHVPLPELFQEVGLEVKPKSNGQFQASHSVKHDSKSGFPVVIWEDNRWWCPSCKDSGDAADFWVQAGRATDRTDAERQLTERFGPQQTKGPLIHLTDFGNALRLVNAYGSDLRFCHPWGKYFVWNGKCWSMDSNGTVQRWAKQTIRDLYDEAAGLMLKAKASLAVDDDHEQANKQLKMAKALAKWALKSEDRSHVDGMLFLARSETNMPLLPQQMDANPWLLNVLNGTVDLKTGNLLPHKREHLLTKLAPVTYDATAKCPTWLRVLHRSMDRNERMVSFLQRIFGYALTGDVGEQVFFILWGAGANGKGTIINTLLGMLGDYALKATQELLMTSKGESHPTERTRLFGARLVAAVETSPGQRLNEAFVKELTGGDPITARRMREDFWTFDPTHKVFLATNHKPVIRGTDHAIWRRPKLIPFDVVIPDTQQDKNLLEKLKAEWPGILAWMVRGCLEWQRNGLDIPNKVEQATTAYRREMDALGPFIEECCVTGPLKSIGATDLYSLYEEWCHSQGYRDKEIWKQRTFGLALGERGFVKGRETKGEFKGRVRWFGIGQRGHGEGLAENSYLVNDSDPSSGLSPREETLGPFSRNTVSPSFIADTNRIQPNPSPESEIQIQNTENAVNDGEGSILHHTHQLITDPAEARALAASLATEEFIGLDLETTGLDPHSDRIRLVQIATSDKTWVFDAYRIPATE